VEARAEATALDLPGAQWPGEVRGIFDIDRAGNQVIVGGDAEAVLQYREFARVGVGGSKHNDS